MSIIFGLLAQLVQLYTILIFVRLIISWIPNIDPYNQLVQMLYQVTEPVLAPARAIIPPFSGMDFSPIVVFIVLNFIQRMLLGLA